MNRTIEARLEDGRILVYGVSEDASIKARIAAIYNDKKLTHGTELYQAAYGASKDQDVEKSESTAATLQFNDLKGSVHDRFMNIRGGIRYFFKADPALMNKLQMNKQMPTNYAQWRTMIDLTLTAIEAQPVVQEKLTLINLPSEQITAMKADLAKLEQLRLSAEKEDGEAQRATVKKQESFEEFMNYCSDLRECLNLFYHGNDHQELEKVGITVK
ncbi:hypothetical protein SAMN06265379_101509 [Saccharicrinis carchari]|uniref:Uncharacterized protein n=1 Tax=Saccharicrinis carchari TaxID=1168039 RepID=A0A521AXC7_SACCC|nr:hypothetical protein [Saccharicrinis carchari]SMO39512.1 hypothetical protein SAMN06265379_101509 [Saccharicrinis carchari]